MKVYSTKNYINGMEEKQGQMKEAREILHRLGIYHTLGNLSPLFPNKLSRVYKHIETITLENYEFMFIESEVMSFSLGSLTTTEPFIQREVWFQPTKQ